jgi:hypothetical protein
MANFAKDIQKYESMLLRLEAGEFKLEEEDYRNLEDGLKDIEALAGRYPARKEALLKLKDDLKSYLEIIKKLIALLEYEMVETKTEMTAYEYVPEDLVNILKEIYEASSQEFTKLSDIAMAMEDLEEDLSSMPEITREHEYGKLLQIADIIKKNMHLLLNEIRTEKKDIYDFELEVEE